MTNKDFSVNVLQTLAGDFNSNSCVISWNRSLVDTDFVKQTYKLCYIMDNSGSMDEYLKDTSCEPPKMIRKMDVVKETLIESLLAIRGLNKKTGITIYVCLVTFNNLVNVVMPLTVVNDSTFQTFVDKINSIGCGGSTLLGEALESTMTLMNTGSLPNSGGFMKSMKSLFSKIADEPGAPPKSVPEGISKLVLLTDGHANGPMKPSEIVKKFADKVSICVGIGDASNYDADLLKALSPQNTYGGFSADTIRQNFVGALFSMYTLIAKDVIIKFPNTIDFITPSELKSAEGFPAQIITLPDFHPMRKIVLSFNSPKDQKVALPCEIQYYDIITKTTKTFNIIADPQPDTNEFNLHITEYCTLTCKFTKITNAINLKFGNPEADLKNTKEQQDEIEKLFNHMTTFKKCSPDNPIFEMWNALYYEIEKINNLRNFSVQEYVGSMFESRQQQSSGAYTKIMKRTSEYMSKLASKN
ncbi:MAG: hypothetical protein Hyperionvirus7_53 [Hyperionvirus sp.]|uniref:VWFA domain-containing protein n=1 Tax=Hyperionvirus sp. TaxID=2487770 RepID=A0A3G5A8S9_9VIRU|nr:MAG: hypothetical protein Hyperionvirus7_53 [Hyperionvirus sp.]